MNEQNIFNKPEFRRLSHEKKEFIKTILQHEKFSNTNDAMKVFLSLMAEAKSRNINFSKDESSLLIAALFSSLDADGKRKAEQIIKMTGFHK